MKELLFLAHRIPYPPNKGDKIRSFNLLKHLARDYRVHLGAFIDDPQDWRHVSELKALCSETCFVDLHPARAKLRSLAGLFTGEALTLPYYRNRKLQAWVRRLLADHPIRRVFVFSSAMAQYVDGSMPGVRRVLDFVDMDSDKWRQYAAGHPWPLGWVYRREADRLFACERRLANTFETSLFVSEAEARLFTQHAPETADRVGFIENGVDTDFFSPDREYPNPYAKDEKVLVFTGAMDYWANADAVTWFARRVFPEIRARIPAARFYIVGSRPTKEVLRLGDVAGVCVTGAVPDIRPYLAHAHVAVAPLRIARGVQNKVLEAMAMGRPVLASPQAMDGIRVFPGVELLVTDIPEEMAQRAIALLTEGDRGQTGQQRRECVLHHYNWTTNLQRIGRMLEGDGEIPGTATLASRSA
jgi:sugar transferase (PEP-CTERM/EpsH1 system associated)